MLAGERTSNKILPTYPTSLVVSVTSPLVEDYQWASPLKKKRRKKNREKNTFTLKSTPCHRLCLQGIEESLLSKAWPITVSTIDVFTSRNPLTFICSSIGIMAISKRGPFATDDITHASRWLEWVDGFDKPYRWVKDSKFGIRIAPPSSPPPKKKTRIFQENGGRRKTQFKKKKTQQLNNQQHFPFGLVSPRQFQVTPTSCGTQRVTQSHESLLGQWV